MTPSTAYATCNLARGLGGMTTKGTPRVRPPGTVWTAEMDASLKALAATGIPMTQVGDALGVSKSAAIGRLWRLRRREGRPTRAAQPSMPRLAFLEAEAP